MFRYLAAKFIKDSEHVERAGVRLAYGRLVSVVAVAANGLLFLAKALVGLAAGSVAVLADGVNNLSDAASNVVSLLGFWLAARPADADHPYGHGRYEYLAGLTVAVLILAAGVELGRSSVLQLLQPQEPAFSWLMAAVLAGSMAVKLWMMAFQRKVGRRIGSKTLEAAAADSRNDVIATGVVLAGMAVGRLTGLDLDGWLGIAVAAFVLFSGFSLVRQTLDPLLGRMPDPEEIESIRRRILACPGVLGTHDLMLHDYGPGRRFASAHVEMAAEADPAEWHQTLDALARRFLEEDGLHILFQYDPISQADTAENRLRDHLAGRLGVVDRRSAVHDVYLEQDGDGVRVRFDWYVPAEVDIPERELLRMAEDVVRELYPDGTCRVTLDRGYMAPPKE